MGRECVVIKKSGPGGVSIETARCGRTMEALDVTG